MNPGASALTHLRDEGAGRLTSIPVTVMSPEHLVGEAQTRKIVRKGGLFIKVWENSSPLLFLFPYGRLCLTSTEQNPFPSLPCQDSVLWGTLPTGRASPSVDWRYNPWGKVSAVLGLRFEELGWLGWKVLQVTSPWQDLPPPNALVGLTPPRSWMAPLFCVPSSHAPT